MSRQPFKPTVAQRRSVSIAAGGGMAHADIAEALGISRPTLNKYFQVELLGAALRRRMDVLVAMHRAAMRGNVTAQKAFLALTPATSAQHLPDEPKPRLGKKQQAQADSKSAQVGTEWEDLLPSSKTVQ
jgi:AcrR family transcriptional regulator